MAESRKLKAALVYAQKFGWAVFPVHGIKGGHCSCGDVHCKRPGKHPIARLVPHGLKDASKDPDTIRAWWKAAPDANIGIATGAVSGFFALDVDIGKGGEDSLYELRQKCPGLIDTVSQITGSGGAHYLFKHPGFALKNSVESLGPGLDIRADGGYIVVPPSDHISGGRYEWEGSSRPGEVEMAAAPEYLIEQITKPVPAAPAAPVPEQTLSRREVQRIRSALWFISADERDPWYQVGMALHSTGAGQQAFGLWCEWAATSEKFDPKDSARVWKSFKPGGGIGLGTLFEMARAGGWTAPSGEQPAPAGSGEATPVPPQTRADLEALIGRTDDVDQLIGPIARAVADGDLSGAAKDQLLKLIARKAGVGIAYLRADVNGDEDYEKPQTVYESPAEFVKELNERHAIVSVGGKCVIMNQEYDPVLSKRLVTFSDKDSFNLRYAHRQAANRSGEERTISEEWLCHPKRRWYDGVTFAPEKETRGWLNLWQGWSVTPKDGSYGRFQDLIFEVICAGNDELYDYVWMWLAHLAQRPWELPGTALVLRGLQGTGKNKFADWIGALCSAHYLGLTNMDQVVGRFSGHLASILVLYANEAIWGGRRAEIGNLNAMITDQVRPIEDKGMRIFTTPNCIRMIVAANHDFPVHRDLDDRRFLCLDVSANHKEDHAYFAAIDKEMRAGGLAGLLFALKQVDISDWHPRRLPGAAKGLGWDIKVSGARGPVLFWLDCLRRGYVLDRGEQSMWPDQPLVKRTVYAEYQHWCEEMRSETPVHEVIFAKAMKGYGVASTRPRDDGGPRLPSYRFDPWEVCARRFTEQTGIPVEDDDG